MPSINRVQYSARSQEEALGFMAESFDAFTPLCPGEDREATLEYRSADTGPLAVDRIAYSHPGSAAVEPPAEVWVFTSLRGHLHYQAPRRTDVRIGPRDSYLLPTDGAVRSTWTEHDIGLLRVDAGQVRRVAAERIGVRPAPVRFLASQPVDDAMGRFWHSAQMTVTRQFLQEPAMEHALLQQASVDYICSALLAAFPNSAAQQDVPGHADARPASIRRAIAYIDEFAGSPITMTDVAAAAGVTPRALQQGFARHLSMRPMEYLRTVRLERAHHDLREADPERGATVAGIAARWGFARPERFAAAYRRVYGVPPSRTLRSDGG